MEDEDKNSKSLVLITRVGSTPTTGIKRKPSSLSGGLSFYLRRVSGSNSTAHSPKRSVPILSGRFFFICGTSCVRRQFCSALFLLCERAFLPVAFVARLSREWPFVLPKSRTLPGKKHRKTASAIYYAVSYRFYNVFYEKGFTNEFQKHII